MLRVEHLSQSYRSGDRTLEVLRDVSFALGAGESCAILGPSGSGKTTLLGLSACLDRPTAGDVWLAERRLAELDEEQLAALRRDAVGFVFQTFQLLPTLTALENVMVPAELRGDRRPRARARELLDRVGLADRVDHYPVQLSGGEQQRVGLARAFINKPRILFADEPTGNLDGETAERVQSLLLDLNADQGTSLLVVTHDRRLAALCERTMELEKGRVVVDQRRGSGAGSAEVAP